MVYDAVPVMIVLNPKVLMAGVFEATVSVSVTWVVVPAARG